MRYVTRIKQAGKRTIFLPSIGELELKHAYEECRGNVAATAVFLGVHRSTVYRLLDRYGIVAYLDVKEQHRE